jgi:hypothetical protein
MSEEIPDLPAKMLKQLVKDLSEFKYSKLRAEKFLSHIDEAFSMPSFSSFASIEQLDASEEVNYF